MTDPLISIFKEGTAGRRATITLKPSLHKELSDIADEIGQATGKRPPMTKVIEGLAALYRQQRANATETD